MELTTSEIKRLMISNYRRFKSGEITDAQAIKENTILAQILKATEVTEESARISALEDAMNRLNDE
jgi:hypothetical protein